MSSLALINGKVLTVDPAFRIVNAIATRDGRVVAVGDDTEVREAAGAHARVIDLHGRTVVPGLTDGHAHMDREGIKSVLPSLEGAESIDDVLSIIRELVRGRAPGEWIVTMPIGEPPSYWDVPGNLKEDRFPNRWELDRVAPDNPVYIRPIWGYWRHRLPLVSIANSAALRTAGLTTRSLPETSSIHYDRDLESGELTGIFYEWNYMPVLELSTFSMIPRFTAQERSRGLRHAMRSYNAYGTTCVFEEHGAASELIRAYQDFQAHEELTVRTRLSFSPSWSAAGSSDTDALKRLMQTWGGWLGGQGLGNPMLRVAGMFVTPHVNVENDIRQRSSPYTGWSGFNYDTALPRPVLTEILVEAARQRIRPGGITMDLLDVYEEVDKQVPIGDQRWIIGHLGVVTAEQLERAKRLGLVLTTHTTRHLRREGKIHRDALAQDRHNEIVPLRAVVDAGIPFALATDNAGSSLFESMWHCVARIDRYADEVIAPEQRITREEALRAATMGGAYLTCEEEQRGSLEAGKVADLAVLSDDPLTVDESQLRNIASDLTVVDGRIVYERFPTR